MIRRMKDEVLGELPQKKRIFLTVEVKEADKQTLQVVKSKMNAKRESMEEGDTNPIVTQYFSNLLFSLY
jgi:hypothetical protein